MNFKVSLLFFIATSTKSMGYHIFTYFWEFWLWWINRQPFLWLCSNFPKTDTFLSGGKRGTLKPQQVNKSHWSKKAEMYNSKAPPQEYRISYQSLSRETSLPFESPASCAESCRNVPCVSCQSTRMGWALPYCSCLRDVQAPICNFSPTLRSSAWTSVKLLLWYVNGTLSWERRHLFMPPWKTLTQHPCHSALNVKYVRQTRMNE